MSGGPPYYGFTPGGAGGPPTHFPSAPYPHNAHNHPGPGGIPTHFPPNPVHTSMYPQLPLTQQTTTTTNYYPAGVTNFTPLQQSQSHTSFQPAPPFGGSTTSSPRWVNWSKGQMLPAHAVLGGRDCDGTSIYVGRLQHKQDLIPAKVIPMKHVAYVSYDGKEIPYTSCQVLCYERPNWAPSSNGHVPAGAIPVGHTGRGETLYAARFHHNGSLVVGKLHPSHRTCYIPFGGKEVGNINYEVLIG